jgi:uncharacterized protein YjeT (DUF2065 family)
MNYVLMILGFLTAAEGVLYIFKPRLLPQALEIFSKGKMVYVLSVIWTAFASVMLLGARQCPRTALMIVLALVLLTIAIILFMADTEKLHSAIQRLGRKPKIIIRIIGFGEMTFGFLIVYATLP